MDDLPPQPLSGSPAVVYGLEDIVPLGTAILVGAQHVMAMVVGTITPPLLLGAALKFPASDTAYLISLALLASGLGTFLQCRRRGPAGSGLLSVTGTSFAFIGVLTQAWHAGGFALMFGLSCLTAPLQIILSPFLRHLRAVFTPLVSGIVVRPDRSPAGSTAERWRVVYPAALFAPRVRLSLGPGPAFRLCLSRLPAGGDR